MQSPSVSFIVPTIWRPSLTDTLESIEFQTDDDFECIVIGDPQYVPGTLPDWVGEVGASMDARGSAGLLRNEAIRHASAEWVAFVDDDDEISPLYVHFLKEAPPADVVVFRMHHPQLGIVPPVGDDTLAFGKVGISFAVRRKVALAHPFVKEDTEEQYHEDWELIKELQTAGYVIYVSEHILYHVRPSVH